MAASSLAAPAAAATSSSSAAADEHPLRYTYQFTFLLKGQPAVANVEYDQRIQPMGKFATVEQFWRVYSFQKRPSELASGDYHLFREGIKPIWEDPANENGGKWMIRLRKGLASRLWESLLLAVIGEQFDVGDEICGVVLSVRPHEDILALWTRTAADHNTILSIRDTIKGVLSLPGNTTLEYKAHNSSLQDRTSFRNTDKFR